MRTAAQPPVRWDAAPWQRPDLLPPISLGDLWGALRDGKVEPVLVDRMVADFRKIPGAEQWNGKTERCVVGFVAEPGRERIVTVAESSTFRPIILEASGHRLTLERSKNGWASLLLAVACGALAALEIGQAAFVPALLPLN